MRKSKRLKKFLFTTAGFSILSTSLIAIAASCSFEKPKEKNEEKNKTNKQKVMDYFELKVNEILSERMILEKIAFNTQRPLLRTKLKEEIEAILKRTGQNDLNEMEYKYVIEKLEKELEKNKDFKFNF